MKNYLDLIPISARVRRRQNRMTLLCIVISVFLVTTIFSAAQMLLIQEQNQMREKHGNWHLAFHEISEETAEEIRILPDIRVLSGMSVYNKDLDQDCYIISGTGAAEKKVMIHGSDADYLEKIYDGVTEGRFPTSDKEILLTANSVEALGVEIGDPVTVRTPAGDTVFTVSGFGSDDAEYYQDQTYLVGAYLTEAAFQAFMERNRILDVEPVYYAQFENAVQAAAARTELMEQYHLSADQVEENTGLLGAEGQSSNRSMQNIYGMAAILFVLVLLAGILMISGSMNSTVAQRSQFFGMLRCLGASKKQVCRLVCLEALNWCATAVPAGLVLGSVTSMGLCAVLRYGIGGEFAKMPVWRLSPVGLIAGAAVGVVTVLLAAQAPAGRAAKVAPIVAVSNRLEEKRLRHRMKLTHGRIENRLGVRHAAASGKTWVMMTGSFALSIILFLSFSVFLDVAGLLLPAENETSADMVLNGYGNALVLDPALPEQFKELPGVKAVYGCEYVSNVPATAASHPELTAVNLAAYDEYLRADAKNHVLEGSLDPIYQDKGKAAVIFDKDNPLQMGDQIQIDGGQRLEVACVLSEGLYSGGATLLCAPETFAELTGTTNYALVGIQLENQAPAETISQIKDMESTDVIVTDLRHRNQEDRATYLASRLVCYGFLSIIALIALCNIVNSLSMSVSARTRQYGAMRAVGMDTRQLTGMIAAEALTYAGSGLLGGGVLGIFFHRLLYQALITRHFGLAWSLPLGRLSVAALFLLLSVSVAVYGPVKRMRGMAITETINEL